MIESLRVRWPGGSVPVAGPDPLMLSDRVTSERRLLSHPNYVDSPAADLTAEEALENSAWWRAIHIIAWIMARTPFHIKEVDKSPNGIKKTPAIDHAGYFATTHQANPDETAFEARFRIAANAVQYGPGYAGIWRDAPDGLRIYPFESWEITKKRVDGRIWYFRDVMPGSDYVGPERWRPFPSTEIIEISGLRRRGLVAHAVWWLAKNSIADGIEASKVRTARSQNGGRPAFALSTPAKLTPEIAKRVMDDFQARHSGYASIGKPPVLDNDLKPTALPYAPEFKAEEVLSQIPLREIANFTGVPPVLLGDTEGLAYEALEKLIETLFRFCIEPYWSSFEDQVRAKLLTEDERRKETHTAEFHRDTMAFMTAQDKAQMIRALGAGTPVETPNGIRAWLGKPPLSDPEADKLQMPKNIGDDGSTGTPSSGKKNDAGRPRNESDQQYRAMANAWDDTTRRILRGAERAASNDKAFMQYCDQLDGDSELRDLVLERSRAAGSLFGLNINEIAASSGLTACKMRLLEVAGEASVGKLHDVFHADFGKLMVLLPDLAAKAVMESCHA